MYVVMSKDLETFGAITRAEDRSLLSMTNCTCVGLIVLTDAVHHLSGGAVWRSCKRNACISATSRLYSINHTRSKTPDRQQSDDTVVVYLVSVSA